MLCWADVSTSDPRASREFYAGLFGWTYRKGSGYYTALLDDVPVAGVSGAAAEPGDGIAWTPYLASGDIRRTAQAVAQQGGEVLHGPMRIPRQGTMLFARDPAGAGIAFWQPAPAWTCRVFEPAALWWAELYTPRPGATGVDMFYAQLFGYQQAPFGDAGDYTVWSLDGTPYLGRAVDGGHDGQQATEPQAARWQLYFAAPEGMGTDAAADRAVKLGGAIVAGPFDHTHGRAAVIADPCGASFTVIAPARPLAADD